MLFELVIMNKLLNVWSKSVKVFALNYLSVLFVLAVGGGE